MAKMGTRPGELAIRRAILRRSFYGGSEVDTARTQLSRHTHSDTGTCSSVLSWVGNLGQMGGPGWWGCMLGPMGAGDFRVCHNAASRAGLVANPLVMVPK